MTEASLPLMPRVKTDLALIFIPTHLGSVLLKLCEYTQEKAEQTSKDPHTPQGLNRLATTVLSRLYLSLAK